MLNTTKTQKDISCDKLEKYSGAKVGVRVKTLNTQGGYVITINTLLFLAISVVLMYGVISPIISSHKSAQAFVKSKQSFVLANSATEEALYRLKNSLPISSAETLTLNGYTANISVADTSEGKILTINSNVDDFQRDLQVSLIQGAGVSFNYGLQTGQGGFLMSGGAYVTGNIYSNGDVIGSGGSYVTGSVTVANLTDPSAFESNTGPTPPSSYIAFGGDTTDDDAAQSFQVASEQDLSSVRVYLKKTTNNWMNNITLRISPDDNGKPDDSHLATGSIGASQVTTAFNYLTVPLSNTVSLSAGTTYWIVLDTSTTFGSHYQWAAGQNIYASGTGQSGTWDNSPSKNIWGATSPSGLDAYFDLYTSGDTGLISGIAIYDNAWAHEVNNSTVTGTIYCQASSSNNKACDTTLPDPVPTSFPVSEGNIEEWKAVALAGGVTTGNQTYGSDDSTSIGPQKIVGDLTVGSGATLTLTGTVWVTGDITVNGGGKIKLSSSYGNSSGIIISDGVIKTNGGGQFEGSGISGSYIMVLTTSQCPVGCSGGKPAIDLSGGAGAVILNAQNGTIQISGGGAAKQLTAKTISMTGGASVTYESGIADMSFSSQPSGTWNISTWDEE